MKRYSYRYKQPRYTPELIQLSRNSTRIDLKFIMALWSNLSAHMSYQNWKWFFLKTIIKLWNIFLVEFLFPRYFSSYFNIIVAIKQLRVALFPWQLLIQSSFQSQGSMPAVCSTGVPGDPRCRWQSAGI